jgi:hypothetical protein
MLGRVVIFLMFWAMSAAAVDTTRDRGFKDRVAD